MAKTKCDPYPNPPITPKVSRSWRQDWEGDSQHGYEISVRVRHVELWKVDLVLSMLEQMDEVSSVRARTADVGTQEAWNEVGVMHGEEIPPQEWS